MSVFITENDLENFEAGLRATREKQIALQKKEDELLEAQKALRGETIKLIEDIIGDWLKTIPNAKSLDLGGYVDQEYNDQGGTDTFIRFDVELHLIDDEADEDEVDDHEDDIRDLLNDLLYSAFTIEDVNARGSDEPLLTVEKS